MQARVASGQVDVEVKAPQRKRADCGIEWGWEDDKIEQCVVAANKQLSQDRPGLLVMVPHLRWSMYDHRDDIERALLGRGVFKFEVALDDEPEHELRGWSEIVPNGSFLNRTRPTGQFLKRDGLPANRRISAALCIEETLGYKYPSPVLQLIALARKPASVHEFWPTYARLSDAYFSRENEAWVEHRAIVLHNPHAYHPLPKASFDGLPQMNLSDGNMLWSDGYESAA